MRLAALVVLLAACNGGKTWDTTPQDDTDTDVTDTDTSGDDTDTVDTDPNDVDADGDGFTVGQGDCDDDDIWVNPGWDEKPGDGKDNDCDGRIDEQFAGLGVLDVNTAGGTPRFTTFDALGDLTSTVDYDAAIAPSWGISQSVDGTGWVYPYGGVYEADASGHVTTLWDDSQTQYPDGEAPLGWFGIATHPDGYYLMTGADRLWRIEPDGTVTIVAQWNCLEDPDGATDICPVDVAIDPVTGEVALFGYFGGFATWTAEGGLDLVIPDDVEDMVPPYAFSAATHKDGGSFFALGVQYDQGTGAVLHQGVFRWDAEKEEFALKGEWPNPDFSPTDIDCESNSGDFYITANGGWYYTVWRMTYDGEYTGQLYSTEPTDPDRSFGPIAVLWTQK